MTLRKASEVALEMAPYVIASTKGATSFGLSAAPLVTADRMAPVERLREIGEDLGLNLSAESRAALDSLLHRAEKEIRDAE